MNVLTERLREAREKAGLSGREVCRKLSLSKSAVSNWELGKTEPSTEQLRAVADLYVVSADWLLGRTDEQGAIVAGSNGASYTEIPDDAAWRTVALNLSEAERLRVTEVDAVLAQAHLLAERNIEAAMARSSSATPQKSGGEAGVSATPVGASVDAEALLRSIPKPPPPMPSERGGSLR